MDPDPSWKHMKKAAKTVFKALGDLRDIHVMQGWIEKLSTSDDGVANKLLDHVHSHEAKCKQDALVVLRQFDASPGGPRPSRKRGIQTPRP
jgi:CHAD domain-containing protein